MLIVERHDRILEILRERKAANLDALAEALNVSTSTVRRDLEMLERKGVVERTHGGAVLKRDAPPAGQGGIALAERIRENVAQKQAIAREVDKLVQPHMTLLMDGGSTVILAARAITARPLQVVTNSLSIANHFADEEQVELILIGGSLYPRTETLVGPIATGCLADLHADLALYSLAGIYGDEAYNNNIDMARVEQVMIWTRRSSAEKASPACAASAKSTASSPTTESPTNGASASPTAC